MNVKALRLVLWTACALALFGLGALLAVDWAARNQPDAAATGQVFGGPFQLTSATGEPVSEAVLRGKPSLLFFGFTHCPDVCPTTLFEMTGWIEALGDEADALNYVFVTVDPERDTPEVMREYLSAFSDRIQGVTGEPEKIEAMLSDYHIYSRKVPLDDGDYSMDHTATVFLLDGSGDLFATISPQETKEEALGKIRRIVAS